MCYPPFEQPRPEALQLQADEWGNGNENSQSAFMHTSSLTSVQAT